MVTGTASPRRTPSGVVDAIVTTSRLRRSPKLARIARRFGVSPRKRSKVRWSEARTSPARLLEGFGTSGMPADQIRKMLGRAPRLAAALSGSPRDRAKLVRGLVEKVIVD